MFQEIMNGFMRDAKYIQQMVQGEGAVAQPEEVVSRRVMLIAQKIMGAMGASFCAYGSLAILLGGSYLITKCVLVPTLLYLTVFYLDRLVIAHNMSTCLERLSGARGNGWNIVQGMGQIMVDAVGGNAFYHNTILGQEFHKECEDFFGNFKPLLAPLTVNLRRN